VKKFLALSAFVSGYAPSRAISVTHRLNKGRANDREPSHRSINSAICNGICAAAAARYRPRVDAPRPLNNNRQRAADEN
jgi:hypothetical protein